MIKTGEWNRKRSSVKRTKLARWIFLLAALTRACRFQRATKESEIFGGEQIILLLEDYATRDESNVMKPSRRERSARVDDDQNEASSNFRASINDYPIGMVILSNVLNIISSFTATRHSHRAFTVILSRQTRHRRSWASLLTSLVDEWIDGNSFFVRYSIHNLLFKFE